MTPFARSLVRNLLPTTRTEFCLYTILFAGLAHTALSYVPVPGSDSQVPPLSKIPTLVDLSALLFAAVTGFGVFLFIGLRRPGRQPVRGSLLLGWVLGGRKGFRQFEDKLGTNFERLEAARARNDRIAVYREHVSHLCACCSLSVSCLLYRIETATLHGTVKSATAVFGILAVLIYLLCGLPHQTNTIATGWYATGEGYPLGGEYLTGEWASDRELVDQWLRHRLEWSGDRSNAGYDPFPDHRRRPGGFDAYSYVNSYHEQGRFPYGAGVGYETGTFADEHPRRRGLDYGYTYYEKATAPRVGNGGFTDYF